MSDKYEETISDPGCRRMRTISGRIDDPRPLVAFFYALARDTVPVGALEEVITRLEEADGPFMFTNGWLAQWAQDAVDRLSTPENERNDSA